MNLYKGSTYIYIYIYIHKSSLYPLRIPTGRIIKPRLFPRSCAHRYSRRGEAQVKKAPGKFMQTMETMKQLRDEDGDHDLFFHGNSQPYGSMATVWEGTANPPNYSKLYPSPTSWEGTWIHRAKANMIRMCFFFLGCMICLGWLTFWYCGIQHEPRVRWTSSHHWLSPSCEMWVSFHGGIQCCFKYVEISC